MNRIHTLALATALVLPFTASAGTFTGWSLNGSAALVDTDDTLRLTTPDPFLAGSAWAPGRVSLLGDFSVAFAFSIYGGSHADGLTFTVHNADAGTAALGQAGGYLGYQGIDRSMAFVYDTYDNGFDTDRASSQDFADNTSVTFGGDLVNTWGGTTIGQAAPYANGLREQTLYSWVDYTAANGLFLMYLSDTNVKPVDASENIVFGDFAAYLGSSDALLGFTAATGGATDFHDIQSFSVTSTPVPLPAAAWLIAPGLLTLLRARRRTS